LTGLAAERFPAVAREQLNAIAVVVRGKTFDELYTSAVPAERAAAIRLDQIAEECYVSKFYRFVWMGNFVRFQQLLQCFLLGIGQVSSLQDNLLCC